MTKIFRKSVVFMLVLILFVFSIGGCSNETETTTTEKTKLVFGYADWDTQQFMTRLAGYIAEKGYGYEIEYAQAANVAILVSMQNDDIDLHIEVAPRSLQEPLQKLVDSGKGEIIGTSFAGTWQGWLVPTYMIKGDPARGIAATAPDLESVEDLPEYWELFRDPEVPTKGRFYSCIPGWQCQVTNELKISAYGLDEYYNVFVPGSDTALATSMIAAYQKGEPWLGYYWSPTWALAQVDMTPLEEPEFEDDLWNAESKYACAYPMEENNIVIHTSLKTKAADITAMLRKFYLEYDQLNAALLYMKDNNVESPAAAIWFLKEYESVWTEWVPDTVAEKVKLSLK